MNTRSKIKRAFWLTFVLVLAVFLLGAGSLSFGDLDDQVRTFTRGKEFNYIRWTVQALGLKVGQMALSSENYLSAAERHQVVLDYLELVRQIQIAEAQLNDIYSDPNISDPQAASLELRKELENQRKRREQIAPVGEAILQAQVGDIASDLELTLIGQPLPPVLYHATTLPWALIVSPRDAIRQEANISLIPDLSVDEHAALEEQVDRSLDISSLVVGIGGVGVYPTMVDETSNLNWLSEVVAHEWVHNFLTLRPLGASYLQSPELRTMNETAASIAGKEIGQAVIAKYYPELLPPDVEQPAAQEYPAPQEPSNEPPPFDFYDQMRITRLEVDRLLAEGKIEQAEQYMEARRQVFWENGYHIRKLNQAWFAFHGAYADVPGGGAAGKDPVGEAVRALRAQSDSLAGFLNRISWMTSFEQLERAVQK